MNHIVEAGSASVLASSLGVSVGPPQDAIATAARAIEAILATAYEAGQYDAVRLLHAVSALLSAAPRD